MQKLMAFAFSGHVQIDHADSLQGNFAINLSARLKLKIKNL